MIFHENRLQTIPMKLHTVFVLKIRKDVAKFVVVDALRVKQTYIKAGAQLA